MKVNIRNLFKGILVAASIFAIAACSSDDDDSGESEKPISQVVINGGSAKDDGTYEIAQNGTVTLTCETAGAAIKYAFSDTEITTANIDKAEFKNVGASGKVTIEKDCTLYAYAELNGRKSALTSRKFKVLPVPSKPEFTASAEAKDGLYPYGTTVSIASTSSVTGDVVTIYYSTEKELTKENAETDGTVYASDKVIKIEKPLKLSAIAKGTNGWSQVTTVDYDCSIVYAEGAFDIDGGNIATVLKAIGDSTTAVTFDECTISGIVTSVNNAEKNAYIYVQDATDAVQIFASTGFGGSKYSVGDYVTVSACTAGMVYGKSGVCEVTTFGAIAVDDSKVTRKIFFKKIPSYSVDFTPFFGHGTLLYAFRGKVGEHTVSPDNIYAYSNAITDKEKINLGPVVKASGNVQFTLWKQLDASDDILPVDPVAVEIVTATPSAAAVDGYYAADTVVNLECATAGAEIYYSTTAFKQNEFDAANTEKFTKANKYTLTDDVTLYTIAVKDNDKSFVKAYEFLTKHEVTFVELTEEKNYTLDGKLKSLAESKATAADDVTYEGILVAVGSNFALVQDKDTGIYLYNLSLPSNARVGSQVSFVLTEGKEYNGLYEVTKGTVTVTKAKAQSEIYYINLTGKDDFTAYTTGQLCGVRGKAADYATAKATVYNKNDDGKEHAYFGNVYNYKSTTIQLQSLFVKDADVIPLPAGFVSAPEFTVATGSTVNSGATVGISCSTAGATIYYTTDGTTPTAASTVYSDAITITADVTIKAIAIKGDDSSEVSAASYTVAAAGTSVEEIVYNSTPSGYSVWLDAEKTTAPTVSGNSATEENNIAVITTGNVEIVFDKKTASTHPVYSANAFRVYKPSTLCFKPIEGKTISKIEFEYIDTKLNTPSEGISAADIGENKSTALWEGSATNTSPVTLTFGKTFITKISITYAE